MSKVSEQLYIGDINQASNKEWLKKHHITHIVNTAKEVGNYYPRDFVYLNLNMNDIENQSLTPNVQNAYKFMTEAMGKGGTVFVHCYAGISRSSSTIIYFLMNLKKWSYEEAFYYLKNKHNRTQPNRGFAEQLKIISNKQKPVQTSTHKPVRNSITSHSKNYTGEDDYVQVTGVYTPGINGNTRYVNLNSIIQGPGSGYYW